MTPAEILTACEALTIPELGQIKAALPYIIIAKARAERDGQPPCGHPRSAWSEYQDRRVWDCPDCGAKRTEYHTRRG